MWRPWPADDGLLVRLRLIGGRLRSESLRELVAVAEEYGDAHVHVTGRANLQLRGLPGRAGRLDPSVLAAIERIGLVPSRTHELVRNVMVSPQSGLAGDRADLRPVAAELDRLLCADGRLADLPGRFLFALDDGRGDLLERPCDLGLVALNGDTAQLRIGADWGPLVPLLDGAREMTRLAGAFLDRRGIGPTAPWHIVDLAEPLVPIAVPDRRLPAVSPPLRYGPVPGGEHVAVPEGGLSGAAAAALAARAAELIVTPWRGVLIPQESR